MEIQLPVKNSAILKGTTITTTTVYYITPQSLRGRNTAPTSMESATQDPNFWCQC